MRRRIAPSHQDRRPPLDDRSQLEIGSVISHQPGTARIDVRLRGAHQRVVRRVLTPAGETFESGDVVLMCKLASEVSWIAICKVETEDDLGLALSQVKDETDLHPPSNFVVVGMPGFVLGQWDAWPGMPVCWEVQTNDKPSAANAGTTYTYGNIYVYPCSAPGRYWMRVRSVRYAPSESRSTFSAYTAWTGAAPTVTGSDAVNNLHDLQYYIEMVWAQHIEGEF